MRRSLGYHLRQYQSTSVGRIVAVGRALLPNAHCLECTDCSSSQAHFFKILERRRHHGVVGYAGRIALLFDGKYGSGLYPSEQRRGVGDDVASLDRIGGDGDPPGFSGTGGRFWLGSLLALTGVVCVIMNGVFILKISPKGDLLTLAAALCWALYSLLLKVMMQRYNARFLTRKVLFYALLTLTPYFALQPLNTNFDLIISWQVLPHLLYLGLVAQTICFILWNVTVDRIGAMRATNLLYLSPVITMLAAVAVLNERITWVAVAGCTLILAGVALSDSGLRLKK